MKQILHLILSLVIICSAQFNFAQVSAPEEDQDFADRVNLALRQVGHELLKLEGDTKSTVPPVASSTPNRYKLNLNHTFNYDTLPSLLHQAFVAFDITRDYHVMIERCADSTPILGYNALGFALGEVACQGREQVSECSNIAITFTDPSMTLSNDDAAQDYSNLILLGLLMLVAAALGVWFWMQKSKSTEQVIPAEAFVLTSTRRASSIITIGKFSFDHQNQRLESAEQNHDLTFRENKLLHHFAQHINEIQTRDMLIDEVWGDEGVIVGRSLDVFISRLRKLLKSDENISIKNIHGVGYRLELNEKSKAAMG